MEDKKEEHHHIMHGTHQANKKNKLDVLLIIAIILGIVLIMNIFLAFGINQNLKKNTEAAKEAARPSKIQLTLIKNSKCADCFDALPVMSYVKSSKVEVLNERTLEFDSSEGKVLVSKYNIQKVPSLLVTGEMDKLNLDGFNKVQDALVFAQANPPYTDASSGRIVGRVKIRLIKDNLCDKCNSLELLLAQIKLAGISISEQKNVSVASDEGKSLIAKYKIGFVPTIILSEDAGAYPIIQQAWPQIGTKEEDAYVLRAAYPPFINLTTGKIRGLVDVIYLIDNSCTDCYNVSFHKSVLTSPQSFAMAFGNEKTIDISSAEGNELISKYNLIQVPTVILSSEAGAYPSSTGLSQFFSIEKDGSYVFRQAQVVGIYKDLTSNTIVNPQEQGQQS